MFEPVFNMDDLGRLNSMTKYPSIPTYHKMTNTGMLLDEREVIFGADEVVYTSEKVDGANGRGILLPPSFDYFVGTREEIVYAKGDRVVNPEMNIAPNLAPILNAMYWGQLPVHPCMVLYGEVYGKDIGPGKNYGKTYGWRLFDVAMFENELYTELMEKDRDRISMWRQRGGTPFLSQSGIEDVADFLQLNTVPYIDTLHGGDMPVGLDDTYAWLKSTIPESRATTDDTGTGKPEGVIVRNYTRTKIAKIRFEDYEKTFRRRK